ncbi:MAG TPA: hypothetical protein VHB48_03935 [Chitinophagaceae bacterium]|nr:hypothetical protein [Chitinophagaceae bacterium]
MKKFIFSALACMVLCMVQTQGHAQLLKKLKNKIAEKVSQAAGVPANSNTNNANQPGMGNNSSGGPVNTMGGGLHNTPPPDVNKSIDDAEKATAATDYNNARYSLQQAMTGLEIELGRQLIKSLPATVDNLNKDTAKNLVQSNQYGFSNLIIQTVYSDGKDKQMKMTVGNNPMYAGIMNMYFNNAAMIQSSGDNSQKMKQVRVKGNQALIQFDQSTGYQVIMQLGQSSMLTWECVNFAGEDEVMNAVNTFDIDGIKTMMGEQ